MLNNLTPCPVMSSDAMPCPAKQVLPTDQLKPLKDFAIPQHGCEKMILLSLLDTFY